MTIVLETYAVLSFLATFLHILYQGTQHPCGSATSMRQQVVCTSAGQAALSPGQIVAHVTSMCTSTDVCIA